MGLLDELKQEADSLLVRQRASQEELNGKLRAAHDRLNEALQYYVQLFNSLNIVKPQIRRSYYIEGSSRLENLLQCDYNVNGRRLTVENHEYVDAIVLRLRCVGTAQLEIEKDSQILVDRLREHLWSHGLKFNVRESRREGAYIDRGHFSINPEVTVNITLEADIEHAQVKISIRNLERLGEYVYVYDYDEVGPELLEEVGRAILNKPHKLRTIGRRQAGNLMSRASSGVERRAAS